jgi:hypothetical protein
MPFILKWGIRTIIVMGCTGTLKPATMYMAQAAADAYSHQLSYSKFTHELLNARPRTNKSGVRRAHHHRPSEAFVHN